MECTNGSSFAVSEVQLSYKSKVKASERPEVEGSKDALQIFRQYWDKDKIELIEEFKVMFLNRANRVLGILGVSSGGMSGTVADPRIIFIAALKMNACYIIIAHNHPSGNLKPSRADEEMTGKIREAGKFLEITLLDHLIITDEDYYSFADEGIL